MAEVKKDETREKRTGSLAVKERKTNQIHLPVKRNETSGTQTDSPALEK